MFTPPTTQKFDAVSEPKKNPIFKFDNSLISLPSNLEILGYIIMGFYTCIYKIPTPN